MDNININEINAMITQKQIEFRKEVVNTIAPVYETLLPIMDNLSLEQKIGHPARWFVKKAKAGCFASLSEEQYCAKLSAIEVLSLFWNNEPEMSLIQIASRVVFLNSLLPDGYSALDIFKKACEQSFIDDNVEFVHDDEIELED